MSYPRILLGCDNHYTIRTWSLESHSVRFFCQTFIQSKNDYFRVYRVRGSLRYSIFLFTYYLFIYLSIFIYYLFIYALGKATVNNILTWSEAMRGDCP